MELENGNMTESDEEFQDRQEEEERRTLTVTELNQYIKTLMDCNSTLADVYVTGEISNFKHHSSGHLYFTLKDKESVIDCVMFRNNADKLKYTPENGMEAVAHGSVSLYLKGGQHMLYCTGLEPLGIGSLYFAFEQLKKKLAGEGLFRENIKKRLPFIPETAGIVTSPTGAAVRDMINVFRRRFPYTKLLIFPALVQGEGAAEQIIKGIDYLSFSGLCDVIIIGRGGGSMEDLWEFNSEELARCIRRSNVPVISAVGHEIDFTISDFASDRRAPTPSAAAEIAVPDAGEIRKKLDVSRRRLVNALAQNIKIMRQRLDKCASSPAMKNPERRLNELRMLLDMNENRLENSFNSNLNEKYAAYREAASRLEALSPLAVIARGYAVAEDSDGKTVKSVDDLEGGERFTLRLRDGTVTGQVVE